MTKLRNRIAALITVPAPVTGNLIITVYPGGYLTGVDIHNSPDRAAVTFTQPGSSGFNIHVAAPNSPYAVCIPEFAEDGYGRGAT